MTVWVNNWAPWPTQWTHKINYHRKRGNMFFLTFLLFFLFLPATEQELNLRGGGQWWWQWVGAAPIVSMLRARPLWLQQRNEIRNWHPTMGSHVESMIKWRRSPTHTLTVDRIWNRSMGRGRKLGRVRVSEISLVGSSEMVIWTWIFSMVGLALETWVLWQYGEFSEGFFKEL